MGRSAEINYKTSGGVGYHASLNGSTTTNGYINKSIIPKKKDCIKGRGEFSIKYPSMDHKSGTNQKLDSPQTSPILKVRVDNKSKNFFPDLYQNSKENSDLSNVKRPKLRIFMRKDGISKLSGCYSQDAESSDVNLLKNPFKVEEKTVNDIKIQKEYELFYNNVTYSKHDSLMLARIKNSIVLQKIKTDTKQEFTQKITLGIKPTHERNKWKKAKSLDPTKSSIVTKKDEIEIKNSESSQNRSGFIVTSIERCNKNKKEELIEKSTLSQVPTSINSDNQTLAISNFKKQNVYQVTKEDMIDDRRTQSKTFFNKTIRSQHLQ